MNAQTKFLKILLCITLLCTGRETFAWENTAGEVEWLHKLTERYSTPHTKWAKPYARGKIKALYFIGSPFQGMGTHAREAVEFMQRFDVEVETVFYYHFYKKDWFGGVAGHRRLDRIMREKEYELFFFQDVSPKLLETCWMGKGAVNAFRPAVEKGAGVVFVGVDDGGLLDGRQKLKELPPWLRRGPVLEAATLKQGRIVSLPARPKIPYKLGWRFDYENWQYEIGRAALWAARREPDSILNCVASAETGKPVQQVNRNKLPGKFVNATWKNLKPEDRPEALVRLRRWDGTEQQLGKVACDAAQGMSAIELPRLPAGGYRVDVIVRSKKGIENFTSHPVRVNASSVIREVKLSSEWTEVGDDFTATVSISGVDGQTLRLRLVDSQGRELVRKDTPVGGGDTVHPFKFKVESWMPMLLRVEAALFDNDGEVVSDYRFFNVAKRNREKFNFVLWDFPVNETLGPYCAATMRRLGVTAILASKAAPRSAAAYDIAWVPWTGGQVRAGPHTEGWHDDKSIKYFLMRMKESRGHGVLTYSLGDEGAVEGAGVGPAAMKAYRDYLTEQYENIDALNQSWKTDLKKFEDVKLSSPKDTDEKAALGAQNYARWYDRQAFKSYNFVQYCKRHVTGLREFDPEAVLGFEGSGRFARRGDPFLICREMEFWVPYGGSVDELVRSFTVDKPHFLRGNWMGYHRTADGLTNKYWRMIMSGSSSVWWWMWSTIGAWQGLIAPDLGTPDYIQEFVDDTAIVRDGLGMLLRKGEQLHDGIALLYSKPSGYAATLDSNPTFNDYEPNHRAWHNVIHDQPMEFRYVDARALHTDSFNVNDFKLLILPQSIALGAREAKVIRKFVAGGGTVIADFRPGVYDDHCKPGETGILDDLFGIRGPTRKASAKLDIKIDGTVGENKLKLEWPDMLVDPSIQTAAGSALGKAGDTPVCIVNRVGKGKAILLNFAMSSFPSRTTARGLRTWGSAEETPFVIANFFRALFALAEAKSPIELIKYKSKNPYVGNIRMQRWQVEGIQIIGLHRETGQRQQVTVAIPDEKHIYDLRDRLSIGKTNRWMNQIVPTRARFFALLPERCPPAKIECRAVVRRGEQLTVKVSVPGAVGPHPLKLTALDPVGNPVESWTSVVLTGTEPKTLYLPVAHNDPPGNWTLYLKDGFSNLTETTRLKVE